MKINFASTKLATILITVLLFFIVLSAIIPQKDIAVGRIIDFEGKLGSYYKIVTALKLDSIYNTPYFFIILALLGINLVSGNIKRFTLVYRTEKTLLRARHIGSIIFHFSLLLIMLGVILNYLYKFEGVFGLTEGQTVNDLEQDYLLVSKGPLYIEEPKRFSLLLEKVDIDYIVENSTTSGALITVNPNTHSQKRKTIYPNNPMKYSNLEFHFGQNMGFSPKISLSDSSGQVVFEGYVRVAHQKENEISRHYDFIILEKLNMRFEIEVLPDNGLIDSTLFKIKVDNHDDILYEGIMKLNETVEFKNYKLIIPSIRRWCYVSVIKSPFLELVFWGFWLALSGLCISFIPRLIGDMRK